MRRQTPCLKGEAPPEILLCVWTYLLLSEDALAACSRVCRRWHRLLGDVFWQYACACLGVDPALQARYGTPQRAFRACCHHFHWRFALWGDCCCAEHSSKDSAFLFDAHEHLAKLFLDRVDRFTVSPMRGVTEKRRACLSSMHVPLDALFPELTPPPHTGSASPSTPASRIVDSGTCRLTGENPVKVDLCPGRTVVLTSAGLEVFGPCDAGGVCPPEGCIDAADFSPASVAVFHVNGDTVYALRKKEPVGVQTWCTQSLVQQTFTPLSSGVFDWSASEEAMWWSQEKFSFKDPTWYGVVIDDVHNVWVINVKDGFLVGRIPHEDPSRKATFGSASASSHVPAPAPKGDCSFPNPVSPLHASSLFTSSTTQVPRQPASYSVPELSDEHDFSLSERDQTSFAPSVVRICGPCVLIWGGRNNLNEETQSDDKDTGRAYVQLWRAESTYNLNSTSSDLVCVLQAKYDNILMAHTDLHRVYVLFNPFFTGEGGKREHTEAILVDVWDAQGAGFVCRRLIYDEDRTAHTAIHVAYLDPSYVQILAGGPEELLFYVFEGMEDSAGARINVRQFSTLASARETAAAEQQVSPAQSWWRAMSPQRDALKKYTPDGRNNRPTGQDTFYIHMLVGQPSDPHVVSSLSSRPQHERGRALLVQGVNCALELHIREKMTDADTDGFDVISWASYLNSPALLYLHLIVCLRGADTLRQVLHAPPLRPDYAAYNAGWSAAGAIPPVISTQLAHYNAGLAHRAQQAASALIRSMSLIDRVMQIVATAHGDGWNEEFSSTGRPLTEYAVLLRRSVRDTYITLAAGMFGCDLHAFFVNSATAYDFVAPE